MSEHSEYVQPADPARRDPNPARTGDHWLEPSAVAEPDSLHLGVFVRRHGAMIAAAALLTAAAAALVTTRISPVYVTKASVRIDQKSWQLPALDALGFTQGNALATELEILRGRVLAEEVVDSLGLQLVLRRPGRMPRARVLSNVVAERSAAPAEFRLEADGSGGLRLVDRATGSHLGEFAAGGTVQVPGARFQLGDSAALATPIDLELQSFRSAVAGVRSGLTISRRNRDAEIIDVSFRGEDAELASEIVNVLARRFVDGRQDHRQAEARSAVHFLGEQIARVSEQLDASERALRQFRERENIVSLPEEASSGVTRRAELQAQRHALEAERSALAALIGGGSTGPAAMEDSSVRSPLAFPTLLRSTVAAGLLTALVTAQEQRNELRARRTADDPDLRLLDARIAEIHAEIRAVVGTYLQGLTNQVAALDAVLASEGAKLRSIPRKELQLAELARTVTSSASIYSMLQTRLKEAQIAAAASDLTVRVVEPAVVPLKPVWPRPLLTLAVALFVGAAAGGAAGFARELTDRSLHTRRDLLARTGVPVLGVVPRAAPQRRLRIGRRARPDLIRAHVHSLFPRDDSGAARRDARTIFGQRLDALESREQLYTFTLSDAFAWLAGNISAVRRDPAMRVLVVTSPLPGDGKTTVATSLALTFARNGRRVLLVDADLRGGRIAAALRLPPGGGLGDWLAEGSEADLPIHRLSLASGIELDVIGCGSMRARAAQLLASGRLRQLVDWARSRYDYTIIDTSPVNVAGDAALVAPESDGVIMVVRAGVTEREAVEFAMEQLALVRAPIAGAVLNDVDLRRDGAYDRSYRYYGQYNASPS